MRINFAHLRDQGIDFAIFDADATNHSASGRDEVLARLTMAARAKGLKIDKSALAFKECGRLTFYGTPDLVRYLRNWRPRWTHWIDMN